MKDISKKLKPLHDRVLISEHKDDKEKKTSSGIILPVSSSSEDKHGKRGDVVAVGPGRTEDGVLVKVSVEVGDKVIFQWGDKVSVDGEEYYLVRESEILAVIK